MSNYSKYNIVYRLQKWIDSVPGQTFLNYAYSWGAAIVILGTLFKLTHLPGANIMLFIGMGTEVCVFFISAFDRPFDKTSDGQELPTHVTEDGEEWDDSLTIDAQTDVVLPQPTIVSASQPLPVSNESCEQGAQYTYYNNSVPNVQSAEEVAIAQQNYVDELNKLSNLLSQVLAQSEQLVKDNEEINNLNRTITGITKVYEMQLKSASKQIVTIDEINAQSAKMAEQIEQLNTIYARMIEAMTINMRVASTTSNENKAI